MIAIPPILTGQMASTKRTKRKTLGGFIACAATSAFITHNVLETWPLVAPITYEYHGSTKVLASLVGLTSALVELRSGHDNLFIPVISSLAMVVYDTFSR